METTTLIVRIKVAGIHCWPAAPSEVHFLRKSHRHLFHITGEFAVSSLEREQEFFLLQEKLYLALQANWLITIPQSLNFREASCESIASQLLKDLASQNCIAITVEEDGENGARVERREKCR